MNQALSIYMMRRQEFRAWLSWAAALLLIATAWPAVAGTLLTPTPTPSHCGDGNLDPGEQCDDGNQNDGDCCSSQCTLDPAGLAFEDGLSWTLHDVCDVIGLCGGIPPDGPS